MASSAPSASAERTPLGKKLNSQAKYLLMKLWEYFKQEAKKCKISINITERISKATGSLAWPDLLCDQCYSISVPGMWGRLRSKQLLELHQTLFSPPNIRKKAVWPRETRPPVLYVMSSLLGFGIHYATQEFQGHLLEWSTARKVVYLRQEKGTKCTLHKPAQL